MKTLAAIMILLSFTACGIKHDSKKIVSNITRGIGEGLKCGLNHVTLSTAAEIKIDSTIIDLVSADLQGRPFSRTSFWTRLGRETRTKLNFILNRQIKLRMNEEQIYKSVVLFFENLQANPQQNYYFRSSQQLVRFVLDDADRTMGERCENQDSEIESIDTSRVIPLSSITHKLNCKNTVTEFAVTMTAKNLVIETERNIYAYAGGEIIRNEIVGGFHLQALDPDQQAVTMAFSSRPEGYQLDLQLYGKSDTIKGSVLCTNQQM